MPNLSNYCTVILICVPFYIFLMWHSSEKDEKVAFLIPSHSTRGSLKVFACCSRLFIQCARPALSKHIWWCFDPSKLSISLNTYII